jgi:hypothetical protein
MDIIAGHLRISIEIKDFLFFFDFFHACIALPASKW